MRLTDPHLLAEMLHARPLELPSFVFRRLQEQMASSPSGVALSKFKDVTYPVDMSLHAISRKYYFHTHEMYLERVFRETLQRGDTFIDIGANMGYWSAFSAALVGREGEIHAFEPVPQFFESLDRFARANPSYRIHANRMAIGAGETTLPMAVVEPNAQNYENFMINIGASSLLPGFLDHAAELTRTIHVKVNSLDDYVRRHNIDVAKIGLIKIDVEGFESYCLDGMTSILEKPGKKTPILCEVLTDKNRREPLDGRATIERLERHGYICLNALTYRPVDRLRLRFEENILCV